MPTKKKNARRRKDDSHGRVRRRALRRVAKRRRRKVRTLRRQKIISARTGPRYTLNPEFEFFSELRSLILKSSPAEKDKLIKRISALGRIRLAVVSGVFLNNENSATTENPIADLLIVGDDINKRRLHNFLKMLEAEVGKEIKFSVMEKEEFDYRYDMFDRFVRVLLEGPHEKIINRLGL